MAREDLLGALILELNKKEGIPTVDDNTLLQKITTPYDTITTFDTATFTAKSVSTFVWGGLVNGVYQSPGWVWNQGQYS